MRKFLLNCIILFFFFSFSLFAQSNEELKKIVDDNIKNINEHIFTYDSSEIDIFDFSTEGGLAKAFYNKNDLVLIKIELFFELGKIYNDYYFKNNEIIFVLQQKFAYKRPIYYDEQTAKENNDNEYFDLNKTIIIESKYYFNDNVLIDFIQDGKNVELNNKQEGIQIFNEINNEVKDILEQFKNRGFR